MWIPKKVVVQVPFKTKDTSGYIEFDVDFSETKLSLEMYILLKQYGLCN